MKTEISEVKKVFDGVTHYRVPTYQRHYVWDENEWARFWGDLRNETDRESHHFTGAVILRKAQEHSLVDVFDIIDGQQRLITLQMILKATRDLYVGHEWDTSRYRARIDALLFNDFDAVDGDNDLQYKLQPSSEPDKTAFTLTLEGKYTHAANQVENLIHSAYCYFRYKLGNYVFDPAGKPAQKKRRLDMLSNALLNKFKGPRKNNFLEPAVVSQ